MIPLLDLGCAYSLPTAISTTAPQKWATPTCIPGAPILLRHQSRAGVCCHSPFHIFLTLRMIAVRCPSTQRQVPGNTPHSTRGSQATALPLRPSSQNPSLLPIPPSTFPLCPHRHEALQTPAALSPPPPLPFPSLPGNPTLRGSRERAGGKALRTPWPGRGFPGQFCSFAAALRPAAEPLVNPPLGLSAAALMSLEEERGREGERTKNCTDEDAKLYCAGAKASGFPFRAPPRSLLPSRLRGRGRSHKRVT